MGKRIPTEIDKFLGLNDNDKNLNLKLGEASVCNNFRITDDYKLEKIEGYDDLFDSLGVHDVKGTWYGKISGTYYFLFACNGNIYTQDITDDAATPTSIGLVVDDITSFLGFGTAVYIINGNQYYKWDNTGDIELVTGYIPLVFTATPPLGGGTANELNNLLTGKKHQTFSADGTSTVYYIAESAVDSIDSVTVGGILYAETVDYTVDLTLGTVDFSTASTPSIPTLGTNNIDIYWSKGVGSRDEVYENYYFQTFGGKNDTRVLVYGDGSNRYHYTGLANGVPSAEYFPSTYYRDIGSSEYSITSLIRQYDTLVIFKENESWYSNYDPLEDGDGNIVPDFPTYPLNDTKGNVAPGQVQLIDNDPFSIMEGIYQWRSTQIRDERNATYISDRVQDTLDDFTLSNAITVDWEKRAEYWLAIDNDIVAYNYRNNTFTTFTLASTPTSFIVVNDEMYFGTTLGQIMKFDTDELTFNGTAISASWEMGMYDVDAEWKLKYLNKVWISLKPEARSEIDIYWETNRDGISDTPITINYNLADFGNTDYSDYSFATNYNAQPFMKKLKAKKFVYFKLILKSESTTDRATVLSINFQPRIGGDSK